ncbi:DUF1552 domain-containing protein [Akkermansiaceae bacterium]|nr:DUF1552 domain-containing protein [Akkermansiaceae bacterium]
MGNQTRFPSLTVGSEGGIHGGCQLSWTRSGVRVPPITNPGDLFDRLFSNDSPKRRLERKGENRLQKSILDAVNDEAKGLSKKVNLEDRDAEFDISRTSLSPSKVRLNVPAIALTEDKTNSVPGRSFSSESHCRKPG